ncbi:hypothetical protein ES703_98867 [subsurface metagenome]
MERTMYFLDPKDMPTHWYNIQADLPEPLPPLRHPAAKEPTRLPPPLFPEALNEQEFSKERWNVQLGKALGRSIGTSSSCLAEQQASVTSGVHSVQILD